MKTLFVLIISLVLFFGCNEVIIPASFVLNEEEIFKVNNEYISIDSSLTVEIVNIQDSRCPSDVVCVWQGEALVEIEVKEIQTFSTVLSTYDNQIDTLGNYSIELVDIKPYPVSDKAIKTKDYDLTLKIKPISSEN